MSVLRSAFVFETGLVIHFLCSGESMDILLQAQDGKYGLVNQIADHKATRRRWLESSKIYE